MQMLLTGFFVSLLLWMALVFLSVKISIRFYQEKILSEKWLLIVPFSLASFLFMGIRYRFLLWLLDKQAIHELFSVGAYWRADRVVLVVCFPLFYVISILKPQWVVRTWINLPLLFFFPFVIRLVLHFSGLAPWEQHAAQEMPFRVE